jgi:hypothetical protein
MIELILAVIGALYLFCKFLGWLLRDRVMTDEQFEVWLAKEKARK